MSDVMNVTAANSVIDSEIDESNGTEGNISVDARVDTTNAGVAVPITAPHIGEAPHQSDDGSLSRLRGRVGEGASHHSDLPSPHPAGEARHPPPQAGEGKKRHNNQPRRDKRDVHGWVVLDKPIGMTSTHAVAVVKRLFQAKRAGHAGTLDPLASGGLPIAMGEATKTVPFVMDGRKRYRFTVRWGQERDTDDTEGRVTQTSDDRPSAAAIRDLLPQFTGRIEQTPPQYSAIKVQGERAYDLARDSEIVELKPRPVEIHHLTLSDQPDSDHSVFEAECGKGTYVRALARDIGRILGCYGHICALRRTLVGPFGEADMIPLEQLEALCDRAASGEGSLADALLPVETALDDIPALAVTRADAARLHRGQAVLLRGRDAPNSSGTVYVTVAGRLLALAEIGNGELIPKRVFNLTGLTASPARNESV
jgi:tRNA pseudouridine55 synthase